MPSIFLSGRESIVENIDSPHDIVASFAKLNACRGSLSFRRPTLALTSRSVYHDTGLLGRVYTSHCCADLLSLFDKSGELQIDGRPVGSGSSNFLSRCWCVLGFTLRPAVLWMLHKKIRLRLVKIEGEGVTQVESDEAESLVSKKSWWSFWNRRPSTATSVPGWA